MPIKTPDGKWVVFRVATGEQLERWPVDARHLVTDPAYSLTAPDGVVPKVAAPPPQHVGVPQTPVTKMYEAPVDVPADAPVKRGPGRPRKVPEAVE